MNPDIFIRQMRDIDGLDPISYWPPGPGWWLSLAGLVVLALLVRYLWYRFSGISPRAPWRRDASIRLKQLQQRVGQDDARLVLGDLSELLRRIAIARCGRDACAGLFGEQWLAWLRKQDPKGFDWSSHGRPLIDLPYAPPGETTDNAQVIRLLEATRGWIMEAKNCPVKQETAA